MCLGHRQGFGLGFRVQGFGGFRVLGLGFRVLGFRVGFKVEAETTRPSPALAGVSFKVEAPG